ncbi:DNA polymerase B region [Staphylothermus marinus F1]|uniref:DNA-directed DNA polymerase n=1 Tax=Staphylothermus marinus (strain ATCC 43588 / DSM 3639 / JCM 9404 / F1) TaxID=399550 RepID=A3DL70_STAMF|nr:DNA polymerase domain-containing protein [Staphylothermus marinus]ABN69380.1 DNA polymerase B region [Staphylothermus marinus F1]
MNNTVLYLFDAAPTGKHTLFKLLDQDGKVYVVSTSLLYRGYLMPRIDPDVLAENVELINGVENVWVENWYKPPYYASETEVIVYETLDPRIIDIVNNWVIRKAIAVPVNTYPEPLIEALWRNKIPVLTPLKKRGEGYVALENPFDPEYSEPPIKYLILRLFRDGYRLYSETIDPEKAVIENSEGIVYEGDLDGAVEVVREYKPLILYTSIVEKIYVEQRYSWIRKYYDVWIDDVETLVDHTGIVYWSRLAYTPPRMLNYATIGRILTTIEALEARKHKYLIINGFGRRESWRSLRSLLETDRGGLVYSPRPGLYWGVCQIDYNSLYPSIIAKYNISGETIDNPYCRKKHVVKNLPHIICLDRRGLVSIVLNKLVKLREKAKMLVAQTNNEIYSLRSKALKWILVSGFGYLGFKNSLFGSIMAHETVTWYARRILREAHRLLENRGYKVIHIIIDSLFVQGGDCEKALRIVEETGMPAKIEAEYTWLYIPKTKNTGLGASNRYYGRLVSGEMKIKGVMCVRKNTPIFIRETQLEAINKLGEAKKPEEFKEKLREAHKIFQSAEQKLINREVESWKLGIIVNTRKRSKNKTPWLKALSMIRKYTGPIVYIVSPSGEPEPFIDVDQKYSVEYYVKLLHSAWKEMPGLNTIY